MTMKYISSVKNGVGRAKFVLLGTAFAVVGLCGALPGRASATNVSCTYIGSGKYDCGFVASSPVRYSNNTSAGTLHAGTNWVKCQWNGGMVTLGSYANAWWAYTLSDQGHWGWVNAVYTTSGSNYAPYGGGVPLCDQSVDYNGSSASGFPPGTVASTKGACSISLPSRVSAGQTVSPVISITNTGTNTITPFINYRWYGTADNGQSMGTSYADLQFAPIVAGHVTKYHLESVTFSAGQVAMARNFQWAAFSDMPAFDCSAITYP